MTKLKTILLVALDINPSIGSEAGRAALWLSLAIKHANIIVVTDRAHASSDLAISFPRVTFHFVESSRLLRAAKFAQSRQWAFAIIYRLFLLKAKSLIRVLARSQHIDAIHCITPAGLVYFNDFYTLGLPTIVGPVGGGLRTPAGFPSVFGTTRRVNTLRDWYFSRILKMQNWREYFTRAKLVLVSSGYERSLLPQPIQKRSLQVFNAVVDTDYFCPAKTSACSTRPRILFSGSLVPLKAVNLLLEAARRAMLCGSLDFDIDIAGDGPEEGALKATAERLEIAHRVHFLGRLTKTEMRDCYRNSDVFCFPSLRETAGNAVVEAMACGLPVVVANYGGPADIVSEDCGFRIPIDSENSFVEGLANAISELLADQDLRRKFGHAARLRALTEFSTKALEAKIIAAYSSW